MSVLIKGIEFADENIYFTFGDGRLGYDCAACGAKCCRGHGYALEPRTLNAHMERRPLLRFFLEPSGMSTTPRLAVRNCPPACFFLTSQGLCGLQRDLGYKHKPSTCRLFPFNMIRTVGRHVVVGPHLSLCPLEVRADDNKSPLSCHADLLTAMKPSVDTDVTPCAAIEGDCDALIQLERRLLEESQSGRAASYSSFVGVQIKMTGDVFGRTAGSTSPVAQVYQDILAVLGVDADALGLDDPCVTRTLLAASATIRAGSVFAPVAVGAAKWHMTVDRVPHLTAAIHVLTAAAAAAGMENVTYQTVMRVMASQRSLVWLLSLLGQQCQWRPGATIDLWAQGPEEYRERYLEIVRGLLRKRRPGDAPALRDVIVPQLPDAPAARALFVSNVSLLLWNRIGPPGVEAVSFKRRLRASVQHHSVRFLSARTLARAYSRRSWSVSS